MRHLAWRDWFAHTAFSIPSVDRVALRPEYYRIARAEGPAADAAFETWRAGRTDCPIVDHDVARDRALAACRVALADWGSQVAFERTLDILKTDQYRGLSSGRLISAHAGGAPWRRS